METPPPRSRRHQVILVAAVLAAFGVCGGLEIPTAAWCYASPGCVMAEAHDTTDAVLSVVVASRDPALPAKGQSFDARPEPGQSQGACRANEHLLPGVIDPYFSSFRYYVWLRRDPGDTSSAVLFRARRCLSFPWFYPD